MIRDADRGRDVLSHMARIAREPLDEDSDNVKRRYQELWSRYMRRDSKSRAGDGGMEEEGNMKRGEETR